MKNTFLALIFGVVFTLTAVAAVPTPSPTAGTGATQAARSSAQPGASVAARAKAWFLALQQGHVPNRAHLTGPMNAGLTHALVAKVSAQIKPLGAPTTFRQIRSGRHGTSTYYVYKLTFSSGQALDYLFVVEPNGKISGLRVMPAL
ncbi:MAG: hypothetical protein ACYDGW_05150 [Vulcanimicrobiaceae bacterium]